MKAIILAVLLVSAFAYTPTKNVDAHVELAEMDKDRLGSTFISAIQMGLNAQLPTGEVSALLDTVMDNLEKEQSEADSVNATEQAFCDETLTNIESELTSTRNSISSMENAQATNEDIKVGAKRDLGQSATDLDETVAALESGASTRDAEHGAWQNSDYEHNEAIVALDEASKLIKHMIHGVSFTQIKDRYLKVQEQLKANTKHATLFKPLIVSLTDLATKLNYEQVVKILDLLKEIHDALVASRDAEAIAEERAQADWDALFSHLTDQKRSLQDKIARLNALITSTDNILQQLADSLSRFRNYLSYLENTETFTEAWCDNRSTLYEDSSRERQRILGVLERLQEHLNDRFGSVSAFLQERKSAF